MILFDTYDVRDYHPDDAAALFVVAAAIEPLDAGQLVAWTEELEGRVENGARVWLLARGRRLAGYALVEPLPGLPGVFDLSGGVVPARRGRGLGGRLLAHVATQAPTLGARQLSARVERLDDEAAVFLLRSVSPPGIRGGASAAPCCWPRCTACGSRGLRRWRSFWRTNEVGTCTKV
jgi:GNAT superfamily N-acetyltransferase